jgi:hypothetical protein
MPVSNPIRKSGDIHYVTATCYNKGMSEKSNWGHRQDSIADRVTQYIFHADLSPDDELTFGEVIDLWRGDESFRRYFLSTLRDSSFSAYRWETPVVTKSLLDRRFEFVLINSPGLSRPVDARAFDNQFREAGPSATVLSFPNLSGDAMMVVPCPVVDESIYGHLASFSRKAPEIQNDDFWQQVGDAMAMRIGSRPIWLNTAGMGVSWLHVRLDSRPKYYHHAPYREH